MSDSMRPRIDRTLFTPISPPEEITLYFCPACGAQIRGSYNLEPARKKCTKTWHLTHPVLKKYVAAAFDDAGHPDAAPLSNKRRKDQT